jgi:hypothetical protein
MVRRYNLMYTKNRIILDFLPQLIQVQQLKTKILFSIIVVSIQYDNAMVHVNKGNIAYSFRTNQFCMHKH